MASQASTSHSKQTSNSAEQDLAEYKKVIATGPVKETNNAAIPSIVCYCLASILMTVVNKFVVSGANFSMNFLLLCMQSTVTFDMQDAKAWFPISFLLVSVIYTGSKSLQHLSIPVYTIFKNLTIILIAYGEVIWFGGRVTALTFVSFIFMVISSMIAAWSDVTSAFSGSLPAVGTGISLDSFRSVAGAVRGLNVGYFWMLVNCLTSAAYVLSMRKKIKSTGFSDWDSMFYNNLLSIPVLAICSIVAEDWGTENLNRNFPPATRNFLLMAIAFSGAAAVGEAILLLLRAFIYVSSSMVGALNKLPVAASGMLFFGDLVTFGSVSAVGVGFFAGVVYAVAKNNQKKMESRQQADAILPLTNRRP
ncbi:hypothetical protein NLJ89_g4629 [Agrocybe chaxingu]|uniref:GDP-mannose transporter n=1 Tax=Agrocybe chaxingu TaxID=84603 RepID=A0A9W8MXV8_9AGAR|nr:hypothetical protein NLJ89_g4629 [Agrocybe chaxingu]